MNSLHFTSLLTPNFGSGCRRMVGFTFPPLPFLTSVYSPPYLWRFCSGPTGERGPFTFCLTVPRVVKGSLGALEQINIFCPHQKSIWTVSVPPSLLWRARSWHNYGSKLHTATARSWSRTKAIKTITERRRRNLFIFIRFCGPSSPYWPGRIIWHSLRV